MMPGLFLLFLLAALMTSQSVQSHPEYVPESVCASMNPDHGRARPQALSVPWQVYDIVIDPPLAYEKGKRVTVRLSNGDIRGFMVQMRTEGGLPVGTWQNVAYLAQTMTCYAPNDTVTHVSGGDKTDILLTWTPPDYAVGDVYITATIVHDFYTYWTMATIRKLQPGSSYAPTPPPNTSTSTSSVTPTTTSAPRVTSPGSTEGPGEEGGEGGGGGGMRPWHIIIILFLAGGALLVLLVGVMYCCRNYLILRGIRDRERHGSYQWCHPKPRHHIGGRYGGPDDEDAMSSEWSWSTQEPDTPLPLPRRPPLRPSQPATLTHAPNTLAHGTVRSQPAPLRPYSYPASLPATFTHAPTHLTHATVRSQPTILSHRDHPSASYFLYNPAPAHSEDRGWRPRR